MFSAKQQTNKRTNNVHSKYAITMLCFSNHKPCARNKCGYILSYQTNPRKRPTQYATCKVDPSHSLASMNNGVDGGALYRPLAGSLIDSLLLLTCSAWADLREGKEAISLPSPSWPSDALRVFKIAPAVFLQACFPVRLLVQTVVVRLTILICSL